MKKANYKSLRQNPPVLKVTAGAREVIITTISAMCDNVAYLRLKKNADGDFRLDGMGSSIQNWQMAEPKHAIEWAADAGDWAKVCRIINSGTAAISEIISR